MKNNLLVSKSLENRKCFFRVGINRVFLSGKYDIMANKIILIGDFSGIQNYIYNIQKNKTATKRLKGRSLFVELLLEKIKENLKNEIGNCEDYLIGGGKFILICNSFDEGKFKKFKQKIEEELFNDFYAELKIIFGQASWDGNGENFKVALTKAYEDVEKNKLRAFETVLISDGKWNTDVFVFDEKDRGPQSVCKFSRDRLVDKEMTEIINKKYLGDEEEKLKDFYGSEEAKDGKISKEAGNDILITEWIRSGKNLGIKILDCENIDNVLEKFDREKLKKGLPFDETEKQIKSFEELAGEEGFNKLAVLKGDIDNLGEIMQFDLQEIYYENYKKLSNILKDFWTKELYDFIDEKYKNKLYVVYAGGDDFVILGRWDDVIEFYKDLLELFKAYVENKKFNDNFDYSEGIQINGESIIVKNLFKEKEFSEIFKLHFSGAINLFGPHDTFFAVVKNTEKLLEKAKDKDNNKNKINIFGQILENKDFKKLFEEAKAFYEKFVQNDVVSTSTLRFLLNIAKKIKLHGELNSKEGPVEGRKIEPIEYITWKAELFYHLGRNYKTKEGKDVKDEFRRYIDGMLLRNEIDKFRSLVEGNEDLFGTSEIVEDAGEKLIVMLNLVLYWKRDKR